MRKGLLIIFAVWFSAFRGTAQEATVEPVVKRYELTQKKYTFAVQPFQLVNWCLRSDFDMRLGKGPVWLQIGPALYYRDKNSENDNSDSYYDENGIFYRERYSDYSLREPFSKMIGGGMDVNFKFFVNASRTFYQAVGVSYTHFQIDYRGMAWNDYIEDGLQYHVYKLDNCTQYINRFGVNYFFGHQIPTRGHFLCDFFWGLSLRQSYSDENKPSFNKNMFSFGWTGIVFMTGVRFGFGIK
jgi:hypothetical protein